MAKEEAEITINGRYTDRYRQKGVICAIAVIKKTKMKMKKDIITHIK